MLGAVFIGLRRTSRSQAVETDLCFHSCMKTGWVCVKKKLMGAAGWPSTFLLVVQVLIFQESFYETAVRCLTVNRLAYL